MQNDRRQLAVLRTLLDLLVMTTCFFLVASASCLEAGAISFCSFLSMRFRVIDFIIFAVFLLVWHGFFTLFGLYRSKRLTSYRREAADVLNAATAGSFLFLFMGWLFRISFLTPEFLALFWVISAGATIMTRLAVRYFLKALRLRGRNLRYLLIVGTNHRALEYARKVTSKPELGYVIVGFVENGWSDNHEFRRSGFGIVADLKEFPEFTRTHVVDEVMVCLPIKSCYDQFLLVARACEEQGIIVRFLSDLFDLDLATSRAEMVDEASVVTLRTGAMHGWPLIVKRGMDVLVSAVLLLPCLPLFALIALAIKLTSQGPVFFTQMRPGHNKRPFKMIKFRTMIKDADKLIDQVAHLNQESGPAFKIKNDPRITPLGRVLRKTSLDELPQLINVLKGEMSLVGPRPLFYWEFERIDDAWVQRRFSVKPGITGLWQVSGRSNVTFEGRIQMDLFYIDNWSLIKDFKILARTAVAVTVGKGAV